MLSTTTSEHAIVTGEHAVVVLRRPRHLRRALTALATVALAASAVGFARFHTHLVRAEPGIDAHVSTPPTTLRLWFSEKPELAVTKVTLVNAEGATLALGPLSMSNATDTAAVVVPVRAQLTPGRYTVRWRVMARDGHPARGTYAFVLDAKASEATSAGSTSGSTSGH